MRSGFAEWLLGWGAVVIWIGTWLEDEMAVGAEGHAAVVGHFQRSQR
jgi:hypothetical protein